jgi:hypothetical protein
MDSRTARAATSREHGSRDSLVRVAWHAGAVRARRPKQEVDGEANVATGLLALRIAAGGRGASPSEFL